MERDTSGGGESIGIDQEVDGRPLRIAMVAPPWFEVPPPGYGGIELMLDGLITRLAERGHHVTLVGAGRHLSKADRFLPVYDTPPSEQLGTPVPEVLQAAASAGALRGLPLDVVHDHTLAGPLMAAGRSAPTVMTVHGPPSDDLGRYYEELGDSIEVVAISESQRRSNPRIAWSATVHNAVDVATFPFREDGSGPVLWLGRFCAEKGPDLAIDACRRAGLPIVLAGKCSEPAEREFFQREIVPRLGDDVRHVGEVDSSAKRELLADARALICPIRWEEPFGMVMIEAMACGTPVVALHRGSVGEIVVDGRTGWIVEDEALLADALRAVGTIDRADCRRHVCERFDLSVMACGYEEVYRRAACRWQGDPRTRSVA